MNKKRYIIPQEELPDKFPTHLHNDAFWGSLGRAVATFGLLEEVLGKAIFSFTATKPYSDDEIQKAYEKWLPEVNKCLTDQLGSLIINYKKAVRNHPEATQENLKDLIGDLKEASKIRNVLCHGSWRNPPNADGATVPFFFNRELQMFDTPVDIDFLNQTQRHTVTLICDVINSVTHMGWQFPGSSGPGDVIMKKQKKA